MKALGLKDLRIAAAPLIPEVLGPDTSPAGRHGEEYTQKLKEFQYIARKLTRFVDSYIQQPATQRKELWDRNQMIQGFHDQMYDKLQELRKVEEAWEQEDFQSEEAAWQQRQRR